MQFKVALQAIRPSFLLITPICVFLGISTSVDSQSAIDTLLVVMVLTGATTAHISANTLNEYFDFTSGLDLVTEKTPFSGGSGALVEHPEMARSILITGLLALMVTAMTGVYLVVERGIYILPVGIVGIMLIVSYTQWINRSPWFCLVAPGLGFGILMVVGTHVILTGEYSLLPWLVSLIPFFLVNNILLLNQYPDIKADTSVGRKTFPIAFGIHKSNLVYAVFSLLTYSSILLFIIGGFLPTLSIIAIIPLGFSLFTLNGMVRLKSRIGDFPVYMGANVAAALLTTLLLGVSIVCS